VPLRDVIFDLDGTLVDSRPGIDRAAATAVARVWPGRSPVGLAHLIGPPIRTMLATAYPDATEEDLDALVGEFRAAYDGGDWRDMAPYPGLDDVFGAIAAARGRAFVVTNKRHAATARILAHLGLTERVTAMRAPEDPSIAWSGKAGALTDLVARYSLPRGTTAYVGDSSDDREAARQAGLPFVAAAYGYGSAGSDRDAGDLAVIESLSTLARVLPKEGGT
jgi:phosphoglycolate phosphatase